MIEKVDPTRDFPGLTDYERPNTWPRELTELFDAHAEVLKDYEREEVRIATHLRGARPWPWCGTRLDIAASEPRTAIYTPGPTTAARGIWRCEQSAS